MKEILYVKTGKNIEVSKVDVKLGDFLEVMSGKDELTEQVKSLPFASLPEKKGRYVFSILDIIQCIKKIDQEISVVNLGEVDFILSLELRKHQDRWKDVIKTIVVCLITFFGAAFSIMTFNNDVDVPKLFGQLYYQFTGRTSNGFTILEGSYALGLGLGVLIFFNHFGKRKFSKDPTPIEVEMRTYEEEINHTLIEEQGRKYKGRRNI